MANKYLEKIARDLKDDEVRSHGTSAYIKGQLGSLAGGFVPLPGASPIGNMAGRAHELAKVKSHIAKRDVPMSEVSSEALGSGARSFGRGTLEGTIGSGLGAGIGRLINKTHRGAVGGAVIGGIAGMVHGGLASSRNSMKDYHERWKQEAKGKKD